MIEVILPRMGFPYGHFVDSKCLWTGPRGFCLFPMETAIGSNKNIAPVFESQRRQSSLSAYVLKFFQNFTPHGIRTHTTGSEDRYSIQLS